MEFLETSDFIAIVGALIGAVAILYMRNVAIQIDQLRKDNEKHWSNIGELRGALQSTRESYVTKRDFDGATNRITNKLDLIDGKFMRLLSGRDCTKRLEEIDRIWRKFNKSDDD